MKNYMLLFVCLLSIWAHGQDAKPFLATVTQKVKSYRNIVIDFRYSLQNASANIFQETKGSLALEGEKYILKLMGTEHLFDGKKLHLIQHEDQEISIAAPNDSDSNAISPAKILSFYRKGYDAQMGAIKNIKGRNVQFVKFTPQNPSSAFKEILLGVDEQTKHIQKLNLFQKNGTQIVITLQQFKTNQKLPKSFFVFDTTKFKDYYINVLD